MMLLLVSLWFHACVTVWRSWRRWPDVWKRVLVTQKLKIYISLLSNERPAAAKQQQKRTAASRWWLRLEREGAHVQGPKEKSETPSRVSRVHFWNTLSQLGKVFETLSLSRTHSVLVDVIYKFSSEPRVYTLFYTSYQQGCIDTFSWLSWIFLFSPCAADAPKFTLGKEDDFLLVFQFLLIFPVVFLFCFTMIIKSQMTTITQVCNV